MYMFMYRYVFLIVLGLPGFLKASGLAEATSRIFGIPLPVALEELTSANRAAMCTYASAMSLTILCAESDKVKYRTQVINLMKTVEKWSIGVEERLKSNIECA